MLLRAITAFLPSMWAWGINLQRFLAPIPAWLPWIATAATLHPSIADRLARGLDRAGERMLRRRWVVGLVAGALVWCLPDRTWMTGDFLIREAASWSGGAIIRFTEALPLEALLYKVIPRSVAGLAVAAVSIAAAWRLTGGAALVAAATIFLGGHLCAFTGLGKPAGLVGLLAAATLIGATRLAREGRSGLLLGASVAVALLTHRSALALIPVWVAALAIAFRRRARGEPLGSGVWLALLLPLASGLAVAPIVGASSFATTSRTTWRPRTWRAEGSSGRPWRRSTSRTSSTSSSSIPP